MKRLLELNSYKLLGSREDPFDSGEGKRFVIFSGDISMVVRNRWKKHSNDKRNMYGKYNKYLLLSPSGSVGITLKNVRYLGIGSVDFVYATIKQIMGRCNRLGSHDDLPAKDRTLINNLYIMTKNMKLYRERKHDIDELCSRTAPGFDEKCPSIERIIYADALHDDLINEDFKNNVLIPASITEEVYNKFGM